MKVQTKSYANITLLKVEPEHVKRFLDEKGRHAYMVSDGTIEMVARDTVIYDEELDELDPKVVTEYAKKLSRQFRCAAFAVVNYNDEALQTWLFQNGEMIDAYCSLPGYLDRSLEETAPACGCNPDKYATIFMDCQAADLRNVAIRPTSCDEGYVSATDRHADMVQILHLPRFAVGTGFYTVKIGDIPADLDAGDFIAIHVK